ncbi:MAG TPA: outer membrane lipoprotein carrier protein LolA [Pseudolabrys sp.]|jgi:outer membrane lipoprotein-sorting protein|nr:outer membrane lipoprotein carrier protein LolA [Pseudolabrys sp.]
MAEKHKVRSGRRLAVAAFLACFAATPALAESVPLPKPRPGVKIARNYTTGAVGARQQALPAGAQTSGPVPPAPAQQTPSVISNPFAALLGQTGSTIALDDKQRAIIKRVDHYLSSVQYLEGNFVQVGPDGRRSKGEFYISKPGKVRFEYDPPSPTEIIADGESVVVRDRNLATQDVYPLSQTPLRFLLADHVNLLKDTNLVAVSADDVFVTVVVEEKNGLVGTSRLMIMFSAKDMQLKQWTVTDPQGYDTTVAVYNLDTSAKPDPSLFRIDYTNYRN